MKYAQGHISPGRTVWRHLFLCTESGSCCTRNRSPSHSTTQLCTQRHSISFAPSSAAAGNWAPESRTIRLHLIGTGGNPGSTLCRCIQSWSPRRAYTACSWSGFFHCTDNTLADYSHPFQKPESGLGTHRLRYCYSRAAGCR